MVMSDECVSSTRGERSAPAYHFERVILNVELGIDWSGCVPLPRADGTQPIAPIVRYDRHIFICTNLRDADDARGSCGAKGSAEVRARFKAALKERRLNGRLRANTAGCLDACKHGVSAVVYPDGVWYGGVTVDDVEEIIDSHLVGGVPVDRLRIRDKRYTPEEILVTLEVPSVDPPAQDSSGPEQTAP